MVTYCEVPTLSSSLPMLVACYAAPASDPHARLVAAPSVNPALGQLEIVGTNLAQGECRAASD